MRVLHVVHGYPPNLGGTQRMIATLSERLVAEYADQVSVFTTNALSNYHFWQQDSRRLPTGSSDVRGVEVTRFPVFNRLSRARLAAARLACRFRLPGNDVARALYNGPLVPGLTRAVARADADVVVASAFPLLHMHAALRGGLRGGKPVVFIGGLHAEDSWGFDRPMIYRAIQRADRYIAYTEFERDHLVARGIRRDRIVVIGGGVDPERFTGLDSTAWRVERGIGSAPLVALVGQQAPHKGIGALLAAMPEIWRSAPDTHLVVAGRTTLHSGDLRRMAASLAPPGEGRVTFLDQPNDRETATLIKSCDIFALPSRHESFGLVYLEAWICGRPVIGARIGSVSSVIEEGRDGLLVDPGDSGDLARAVLRLIDSPDLRRRMGEAGRRKTLERYTWESVVPRFRETYRQVIEERRAASTGLESPTT